MGVITDFIPMKIEQVVNNTTKQVITAERWNELWNLNVTQGDHSESWLQNLVNAHNTNIADMNAALALKSDKSVTNQHYKAVSFNANNGVFTFTREDGSFTTVDTALEKVATNWQYDPITQELVLTLVDGSTQRVSLSAFITENEFVDSSTVVFSVSSHKVTAGIKPGSLNDTHFTSAFLASLQNQFTQAQASATAAANSATDAASSASLAGTRASAAATSATAAATSATAASNSKDAAASSATAAASSATAASGSASSASTSASSATASANSASSSASIATGAATTAANAANEAETSRAAAVTAKNEAASAATSATASKNAAETAATTATTKAGEATSAATTATGAATTATTKASEASTSAGASQSHSVISQSWAVGGTGVRPGEATNNAKYWAQQAAEIVGGDFATKAEAQGYVSTHNTNAQAHETLFQAAATDAQSKANAAEAAAKAASRPSTWTPTATEVGAAVPSTQVSATLTTTWSGTGPFTQAVAITGMTATKNGIIGLALTATAAERAAAKAASLMLTSQGTDTITITADGDKPTIALPIVVTMMG